MNIYAIQKAVADHFGIPVAAMTHHSRARRVARPRQVAMFLSREMTSHSFPAIGHLFGGRDHTTVMHGVRLVADLYKRGGAIKRDVDTLKEALESNV